MAQYLFLLGAPKCGVTTLASWLDEREDFVLASTAEPRYFTNFHKIAWTGPGAEGFVRSLVGDEAQYLELFAHKPGATWRVDASTDYLWCEESPRLIAQWAKRHRVKAICVLRDPVERAISEYQHTVRDGWELFSLKRSLELETERMALNWHPLFYHVCRGRYAAAVERYRRMLGDDLLVLDFHEINMPPFHEKLGIFLGLPDWNPAGPRRNESFVERSAVLAHIARSETSLAMARALVPRSLRPPIRAAFERATRTKYRPTAEEIAVLREGLARETDACRASPFVPTERWTLGEVCWSAADGAPAPWPCRELADRLRPPASAWRNLDQNSSVPVPTGAAQISHALSDTEEPLGSGGHP